MVEFPYGDSNDKPGRPVQEVIDEFVNSADRENPPRAVIVLGGIASGKTTHRKQEYARGYTYFPSEEVGLFSDLS